MQLSTLKIPFLLIIVILSFITCSTSSRYNFLSMDNEKEPDWIFTPPESSLSIYYVLDSTYTRNLSLDEGVQAAMGELSNKLPYVISQTLLDYVALTGNHKNGELIFTMYKILPEMIDNILSIAYIMDGWKQDNRLAILIKIPLPELTKIAHNYIQIDLDNEALINEYNFTDWLLLRAPAMQSALNN